MNKVVQFPVPVASREMIAKLINAGYLAPEQQYNVDAVTTAIAQMKLDLRSGRNGGGGPAAA
jgi:hypothetical protein